MPLHRKVYAVGILACPFTVGIAGVGLDALRTDHDHQTALAARDRARDVPSSAENDVAGAEVQLLRLLGVPRDSGTTRQDRLTVYKREQRGITG